MEVNGLRDKSGGSHVERCRNTSRVRGDILMTPDHTLSSCAALSSVEPKLVGLQGMALTWDATRSLRFVVHAAGWLHSMVLQKKRIKSFILKCYASEKIIALNTHTWLSPPGTHLIAEPTEAMQIKCLALGHCILMSGFEQSNSASRNRHSNH